MEGLSNELPDCDNYGSEMFDFSSSCYDVESRLLDELTAEAINISGTMGYWYVVDYSLKNEPVFGEDNDRTIVRKFPFMFALDGLPADERRWAKIGIEGLDNFHIFIAKISFAQASQMEADGITPMYESRNPHVGDIFQSTHNNLFYQVLDVKDKGDATLQRAHSFDCIVKPFETHHYKLSKRLENDVIAKFNNAADVLAQNVPLSRAKLPDGYDAFGNLVFRDNPNANKT